MRVVPMIKATILFFAIIVGLAIVIQGHLSTVQELPREPQTLFQKTMKPSAGAQTGILKIDMTPSKAFLAGDILAAQVEVDIFGINWRENETCMVEMVFPDALCYVDS